MEPSEHESDEAIAVFARPSPPPHDASSSLPTDIPTDPPFPNSHTSPVPAPELSSELSSLALSTSHPAAVAQSAPPGAVMYTVRTVRNSTTTVQSSTTLIRDSTTTILNSTTSVRESTTTVRNSPEAAARAAQDKAEDERELRQLTAVGGERLGTGRNGISLKGWRIESRVRPICTAAEYTELEGRLDFFRLPEMVFGNNYLDLTHAATGLVLHFSAEDALKGWMQEMLPPVQVPAAVRWKERTRPSPEMLMTYDYTFTTSYGGSVSREIFLEGAEVRISATEDGKIPPPFTAKVPAEGVEKTEKTGKISEPSNHGKSLPIQKIDTTKSDMVSESDSLKDTAKEGEEGKEEGEGEGVGARGWRWEESEADFDYDLLQQRDPILFYDEVILYEDELSDNGIALCSVKIRVMAHCWFILLRFWLRVDGVLMRMRDTRFFCALKDWPQKSPQVIRERSWRESTFAELAAAGLPSASAFYADPNSATNNLTLAFKSREKLVLERI